MAQGTGRLPSPPARLSSSVLGALGALAGAYRDGSEGLLFRLPKHVVVSVVSIYQGAILGSHSHMDSVEFKENLESP